MGERAMPLKKVAIHHPTPTPTPPVVTCACFLRRNLSTSQYSTRSGDNAELVVHLVRNQNAPRVRGLGHLEAPHAPLRRRADASALAHAYARTHHG